MLRGRSFTSGELSGRVAVINERLARLLWRNQDALGQQFRLDADEEDGWITDVGVSRNVLTWDSSGDRPLPMAYLDLASFLDDAARAGRAATGLAIDVESPWGLHIQGDAGRLRQVLLNLVANAARAGANRVRFQAMAEAGRVRLDVADDGPGIPEAIRPRLFEPFATTREDGNGLGLAVSRRIVERHGGSLALLPTRPGATFRIELPQTEEAR